MTHLKPAHKEPKPMPDYYGATLAITGVPAFAVTVEQAEGEGRLR